jgi:Zinc carboxypeptidase
VVGRQTPNCTIGSFLVEGLIRSLLNVMNKDQVVQLLTLCEVHIVPMLNPDGVVVGNTKLCLAGVDLTSQWSSSKLCDFSLPELHALKQYAGQFQPGKIQMILDFECDSNSKTIEFVGRSLRLKGLYHSEVLS